MSKSRRESTADPLQAWMRQHLPGLAVALWAHDPYVHQDVQIDSIKVVRSGVQWLAIVGGTDLATFRRVVCFGGGEGLWLTLLAVSKNIARGRWKADRYAKYI